MQVTVFILFDLSSKQLHTYFFAPEAGTLEASELWVGENSGRLVVIDPAHYYDKLLKLRRTTGNMLSPWTPIERLSLIGQVWGVPPPKEGRLKREIAKVVVTASAYA